jgi:hypothetical protein
MMRHAIAASALLFMLCACSEETTQDDTAPVEQGGEAVGEIEGGSISDAMIPLEALRSQSPTLERPAAATANTPETDDATSTDVETTTVETTTTGPDGTETTRVRTSGQGAAPAPAPPEPPATPGERR